MEERNDHGDKLDEVMLPGFRFHPTDEELVGFYLKRKIQQRPLTIELIRQLDIYKYDPWDLPKMATTGEKEWYFYCPRDRKYRNSVRPNRVTGAGFWKATGTDRPIYSSEGTKCIGLKKSLVFYKGRAARGIKTDWMMHEFRLPTLTDSVSSKKFIDRTIPANDSWAICRIFKKTSSTAQRALSHSFVSPLPETTASDISNRESNNTQFSSEAMSMTPRSSTSSVHFNHDIDTQQPCSNTTFSPLEFASYKPINPMATGKLPQLPISCGHLTSFMFAPLEASPPPKCTVDVSSLLLDMSASVLGDNGKASESFNFGASQQECHGFLMTLPHEVRGSLDNGHDNAFVKNPNVTTNADDQWEMIRSIGFPVSLPMGVGDDLRPNLMWDSPSCLSEMPTGFSTTKCYT